MPKKFPTLVGAAFAHEPAAGATADAGGVGAAIAKRVEKVIADIATRQRAIVERPRC
jgi:hypothetical protein